MADKVKKLVLPSRVVFSKFKSKGKFEQKKTGFSYEMTFKPQKVAIQLELKKPQAVTSSQEVRLAKVAYPIIDEWEKEMVAAVEKADGEILKILGDAAGKAASTHSESEQLKLRLAAKKRAEAALRVVHTTVRWGIDGCAERVTKALQVRVAKDSNLKQLNTEFKVVIGFKVTKNVVGAAIGVTEVVATGGLDIAGWVKIVKGVVKIAQAVHEATKKETKIREEMLKSVEDYSKVWNANKDKSGKLLIIATKKAASTAKSKAKRYKVELGSMLKKTDKFADEMKKITARANKVVKAGQKIPDRRQQQKFLAQAAMIQRKVVVEMKPVQMELINKFIDAEGFYETVETYLIVNEAIKEPIASFQKQIQTPAGKIKLIIPAKKLYDLAAGKNGLLTLVENIGDLV